MNNYRCCRCNQSNRGLPVVICAACLTEIKDASKRGAA